MTTSDQELKSEPERPSGAGLPTFVVLDTNVVLDWLVFRNPDCGALGQALDRRQLHWIVTQAMRDELGWVLGERLCTRWAASPAQVLAVVAEVSLLVPAPASAGPLRCGDGDDQIFIDLALAQGARWLLTRDRALLKLRRRARMRGVEICSPTEWAARHPPPAVPGLTGS